MIANATRYATIFDKLNIGVVKEYQGGVPGIAVNPIKDRTERIIPTIKAGLNNLM